MKKTVIIWSLIFISLCSGNSWKTYEFDRGGFPDGAALINYNSDHFWSTGKHVYYDGENWSYLFPKETEQIKYNGSVVEENNDSIVWITAYQEAHKINIKTKELRIFDSLEIGLSYDVLYGPKIAPNGDKWFMTFDSGVVVFDDTDWKKYSNLNSPLAKNYAKEIFFDSSGNTLCTWSYNDAEIGGVSIFDGTNWTHYDTSNSPLPSNFINDIVVTADNTKWIATKKGLVSLTDTGWIVWDTLGLDTAEIRCFSFDKSEPLFTIYTENQYGYAFWNGSFFEYTDVNILKEKLINNEFWRMFRVNQNEWWGYTDGNGFFHKNGDEITQYTSQNTDASIDSAFDMGVIRAIWDDGTVWYNPSPLYSTNPYSGIIKFEPTLNKWTEYTPYNTNLANDTIHTQITTSTGITYTATNYGLSAQTLSGEWSVFDTNTVENFPINRISAITIDRDGNLWCATDEYSAEISLVKFDGTTWITFDTTTTGIKESYSLVTDSSGTIFIGTRDGVISYDGTNFTTEDNSFLPNSKVLSIAVSKDNSKWFATSDGLAKLKDGNWQTVDMSSLPLNTEELTSVTVDTAGVVWCGSLYGGLMSYNGADWTLYKADNSDIPENRVRAVKADSFGNIWAATENSGVVKFDGTDWTVYDSSNSDLQDNRVRSITISANGSKWFGTAFNGTANLVDDDSLLIVGINSTKTAKISKGFAVTTTNNKLEFYLTEIASVSFRVIDLKGRVIERKNLGILDIGNHSFKFKKRATGMYLMQLKVGNRVENRKIMVK